MRPLRESAAQRTRPRKTARRLEEPPRTSDSARLLSDDSAWLRARRRLGISQREVGILRLLFGGDSEKEIADRLSISEKTVHAHMTRLHLRLGVHNRAQLLVRVFAALAARSEHGD